MKVTDEKRATWLKQGKCHVCGSGVDQHTHPEWMWLAYPVPEIKQATGKLKERIAFEKKINKTVLSIIVDRRINDI